MPTQQQTIPKGFSIYRELSHVSADQKLYAYHHLIAVAWKELELESILCINGLPTVYIHRSSTPISPQRAAELHKQFWNQGVATLLLLIDPTTFHVYSAQAFPVNPEKAGAIKDQAARVESHFDLAGLALWMDRLTIQLETGAYYQAHAKKFNREQTVDQYLLRNLSDTRDALAKGKNALTIPQAHEFLGRILFTCYLIDRGIIDLSDYFDFEGKRLLDWFKSCPPAKVLDGLYKKLFPDLKKRLNGSMFDGDLPLEQGRIKPKHTELLTDFLSGSSIAERQQTLGFWAYEFQMIPTETISGIYEDFLKAEDPTEKQKNGAFYTPRLLAEMTLDVLLENETGSLLEKRFLDPSCGSGIFLVLLFNRLAAEWVSQNPKQATDAQTKADALRAIFRNNLRGIDLNPTACHIACFSLYLAYLDQFDPRSIRVHCETIGKFLPNLIASKKSSQPKGPREHIPVITEADFLEHETPSAEAFDYIIGNPPWAERGGKSLEQRFMLAAAAHLKKHAHAGFLLPSKVLLNKTNAFQANWLKQVSVEKVVLLADYRMILFAEAKCPCLIARFQNEPTDASLQTHKWIEYITPKAYGLEIRNGSIPVSPEDQKWIPVEKLLRAVEQGTAPDFWKSHFWGTPRDQKLLSAYSEFPHLDDYVDQLSKKNGKRFKPYAVGQGFKPWSAESKKESDRRLKPIEPWHLDDAYAATLDLKNSPFVPKEHLTTLGKRLQTKKQSTTELYSRPDDMLFEPPLILFNQGFSKFAYFDYPVRFQDSLQSIAGKPEDADALLFLTAYLKSKLAYYFIFHTSANIGTERTKAQLEEVLNIPFFLPDAEMAPQGAQAILKRGAAAMRRLKAKLEKEWTGLVPEPSAEFALEADNRKERIKQWEAFAQKETDRVMERTINPLIYNYFGLIDQEVCLVEDTYDVLRNSITPGNLDNARGIRQSLSESAIQAYADQLTTTLNAWTSPETSVHINAICRINQDLGLACVELIQSDTLEPVRVDTLTEKEALAYLRLEAVTTEDRGSLRYLRSIRHFEKDRIRIYKPARLGFWMRSNAINDAAALHAEIIESGDAAK